MHIFFITISTSGLHLPPPAGSGKPQRIKLVTQLQDLEILGNFRDPVRNASGCAMRITAQ
jgi:hypothetical protein